MKMLKVGEPYPGSIVTQGASWLDYTESGPILLLAAGNLKQKEIEAVRDGRINFALYETDPILWFLYKIRGFGPWSDCPFSVRMYDDMGRAFDWSDEIKDSEGLALQIILVETGTNIVKVLRLLGLPTAFSREFRAAILRQFERPFSKELYHREIDKVYSRLSSGDLVARAGIECRIQGK